MFFTDARLHFFRPLTGKYREQVVACLRGLYESLYSSQADYSRVFNRDQVVEILQGAITRAPTLDGEDAELPRGEREQANWVMNLLLEHGWLEKHLDEATLQSSYAFSRVGRLFAQPLFDAAGSRFRTRHRNTRNTCNALRRFIDNEAGGDVYDLLDAYEYSERIVSDFSDIIAELDERKRQLVREVEAQQLIQRATDEFFEFMEKRFMPDLAVRLSVDSVEKYRDELADLLGRARRKQKPFKTAAERELRRTAPELIIEHERSVYLHILDSIEARLVSASEVMLPALRRALHGFTRRADIIIRQLSYVGAGNALGDACRTLAGKSPSEVEARLAAAAEFLAVPQVGFVDPDALRLSTGSRKRVVNTAVEAAIDDDSAERRALFVRQAVERAFAIHNQGLVDYLAEGLAGGREVRTSGLPVRDARDLLYLAHLIEVGAAGVAEGPFRFEVEATGQRARNEYFEADEFVIRLHEVAHASE